MDPPVEVEGVHVEVVGAKFLPQFDGSENPAKILPKGCMPRPNLRKKGGKFHQPQPFGMYPCIHVSPKLVNHGKKVPFPSTGERLFTIKRMA